MIHIYYWDNEVNFGDCLADYLIRKLTGDSTFLIQIQKVRRRRIALKTLFSLRLREFYNLISYDSIICTVGSILGWGEGKECVFWGSGFISYSSKFNQGRVLCCRGPLSQKKLLTENGIKCDYYADPALLLPLIYTPPKRVLYKIGIIPHWYNYKNNVYKDIKEHIIDVRTDDIEKVIDDICSCQFILSSSLHGIIVAHAYGIPAILIDLGDNQTDGFKFNDYFTSVGIPEYNPFKLSEILTADVESFFMIHSSISNISVDISKRQNDLLKSAPFKLKAEFL